MFIFKNEEQEEEWSLWSDYITKNLLQLNMPPGSINSTKKIYNLGRKYGKLLKVTDRKRTTAYSTYLRQQSNNLSTLPSFAWFSPTKFFLAIWSFDVVHWFKILIILLSCGKGKRKQEDCKKWWFVSET